MDGTHETPAVRRGIMELMPLKYLRALRDRAADWGATLRNRGLCYARPDFLLARTHVHGLEAPQPYKAK